jgi:hypothetical protein
MVHFKVVFGNLPGETDVNDSGPQSEKADLKPGTSGSESRVYQHACLDDSSLYGDTTMLCQASFVIFCTVVCRWHSGIVQGKVIMECTSTFLLFACLSDSHLSLFHYVYFYLTANVSCYVVNTQWGMLCTCKDYKNGNIIFILFCIIPGCVIASMCHCMELHIWGFSITKESYIGCNTSWVVCYVKGSDSVSCSTNVYTWN